MIVIIEEKCSYIFLYPREKPFMEDTWRNCAPSPGNPKVSYGPVNAITDNKRQIHVGGNVTYNGKMVIWG